MLASPSSFAEWLPDIKGKLIVSCQALEGEPLFGAEIMARMALAAQVGGAAAIRANTPPDIRAIRAAVPLPIFGLYKDCLPGYDVYITPTLEHASQVAHAGADVICIDATTRPRPGSISLAELIKQIKRQTGLPVMGDISTVDEALQAQDCGVDLVSTTLSGYTLSSPTQDGPDLELVRELAWRLSVPVVAEGRYRTPDQAVEALRLGAHAVVVGGAITRPAEITARFAAALSKIGPDQ